MTGAWNKNRPFPDKAGMQGAASPLTGVWGLCPQPLPFPVPPDGGTGKTKNYCTHLFEKEGKKQEKVSCKYKQPKKYSKSA
ncbi:hypothetical protein [Dictyobacter kobayashii]|uniref:Uncharacterized protein n=1 Tax=Dictyobacter kobayashii TaxID=2014872 RepID=A0A402AIF5_9CHLR|nr:hypothetical protein [Dictyobacter kobayashii]GCE18879.1 hypothetical protein KDK_26790 [Dictyobacter kobayashii]